MKKETPWDKGINYNRDLIISVGTDRQVGKNTSLFEKWKKQFIKEILEEIEKEYYGRGIGLRTKEHIVKIIKQKAGEELLK